ncbi:beta-ketoacyl synthase N-terminal-like domain-containing protein [Streptomyces sp. NPDC093707]|uniref:type I polyketide synthase n=1 Tax=Streptomyces sp. NPDC093707 TaxID=3154984 RepID=UPI00344D2B4B
MSHENAVALVGMSCRLPGARDVAEYWRNLRAGAIGISRFGAEELTAAGVDPALAAHPDFVPARGAVAGGDLFDREFFGYSAAEAAGIDPQHRLFLECAAQALDDAGLDPGRVGQWTGVYAGCDRTPSAVPGAVGDPALATQRLIGREKDFLATRVAYKLGLCGPAVTVQTACSTGLVAVHQACRALLGFECDVALAGGASLRLPAAGGYLYQEGGILSPDGRCRAFDAAAAGTVSSDGVGVVVLKRLSDALEQGDRIIAVIRGSAVNNDGGEKVGYTAPSVSGQRDVILMALAQAGVDAGDIGYVEAHGTGTPVGDPVELAALTAAFRESGDPELPTGGCLIGTVKANIGHTGATAGIAGLIKTALMLRHREFVPTPHFTRPNPALKIEDSPFRVSTEHRTWESEGPRLAGVSSFGIGGTNAHLVLEEGPVAGGGDASREPEGGTPRAVCLSAASPEALETLRVRLADRLAAPADEVPPLREVAHTLAWRRQFPHRLTVVARSSAEAAERLRAADRGSLAVPRPEAAFLFPGQGTLKAGHGRSAHALLPVFHEVFEECRARCRARFGVELGQVLDPGTDAGWFTDTRHQQLGLFVQGYALAAQLASWDVAPAALFGHSVGEYVAATVAGVWDWQDALELVWARADAMHRAAPGRMLALRLPPSQAGPLLGDGVALAVAGTGHVVLSGPADRIEELARTQAAQGAAGRLLDTAHAFHSPLMADAADAVRRAVAAVPGRAPQVPYVSNLTGSWAEPDRAGDPDYWAEQLVGTVRLEEGMRTLAGAGVGLLVELGPGDSLSREAGRSAGRAQGAGDGRPEPAGTPLALLGRDPEEESTVLLGGLARLWEEGVAIPWETLRHAEPAVRCALPAHPFAATPCGSPERPAHGLSAAPSAVREPVPAPVREPLPSGGGSPLVRSAWTQTPAARPGAYDGVLLVGAAAPGLVALVDAGSAGAPGAAGGSGAPADGVVGDPGVVRASWDAGSAGAATGVLAASGVRAPLVLAALPAAADPADPGTAAVLDALLTAARRLGAPLLLAGHDVADMPAGDASPPDGAAHTSPAAETVRAAWTAWVEHHGRSGPQVALLDLAPSADGAASGPVRLPALDGGGPASAYAWRGRSWWARAAQGVALPPGTPGATAADPAATRWTVLADGRPDGARFAADLAEGGLRVGGFVDVTDPAPGAHPHRAGRVAGAVAGAPWHTAEPPLTRRSALSRDLDRYCAGLVARHLLPRTGLTEPHGGQGMADAELRRRIDPEDRLPGLVRFCLRVLAEEGWLRRERDVWFASGNLAEDVGAALRSGERIGELPGLKRMLDHVTDAYPAVFTGDRTPVSVLYPDADEDFLHTCLKDNRVPLDDNAAALDALRTVVRTLTARRDDERPLRVLEIGAGTGRLTWPLLADWPGRRGVEYHFTDISPLIVRRARQRAAELGLPDMRFSTYDIGQDPDAQGLVPGSYDLVLGYNVVHATPSVPAALRHLGGLLRPGGRLGLVEVTEIPRWSHVLWGLAPGWWDFADELRTDSIHLDAATWLRALDEAGFADARPVPASLDSDHLVVLAARPVADGDAEGGVAVAAGLRQAPGASLGAEGAEALLYVPDPERTPGAAARWEELRGAAPSAGSAWVVTEDPADWQTQQTRRLLDPDPQAPLWGHVEVPGAGAVGPADLAALLGRPLPLGALRLTGALHRPEAARHPGASGDVAASPEAAPVERQAAGTAVSGTAGSVPAAPPEPAAASDAAALSGAPSGAAAPHPAADALRTAVAGVWCEVLGVAEAAEADAFDRLGGDSLMLVQLTGLIRNRLGHRVSAVSLPRELTFAGLLAAVREVAPAPAPQPAPTPVSPTAVSVPVPGPAPSPLPGRLTLLRDGGPGTPLFLIPPASGSSLCYRRLADHLDDSRPVYGVESPGLHDGRRPPSRLTTYAAHHLAAIRRVQPNGPYLLGGWSFGAMVAHEMSRLLEAAGERVELLVAIDGFLPPTRGLPVGTLPSWLLPSVGLQLEARFPRGRMLLRGGPGRRPAADRGRFLGLLRDVAPLGGAAPAGEVARIGEVAGVAADAGPEYVRVHNASITAMLRHRPRPVAGRLLLLKAGADAALRARLTGRLGALYEGGVVVRAVPGDHWTVLGAQHAPALGAEICRALSVPQD